MRYIHLNPVRGKLLPSLDALARHEQPFEEPRESPTSRSPGTPSPLPPWQPRLAHPVSWGGIKVVRKTRPEWDHACEKNDPKVGSCRWEMTHATRGERVHRCDRWADEPLGPTRGGHREPAPNLPACRATGELSSSGPRREGKGNSVPAQRDRRVDRVPCVADSAINARTRNTSPAPESSPRRQWLRRRRSRVCRCREIPGACRSRSYCP